MTDPLPERMASALRRAHLTPESLAEESGFGVHRIRCVLSGAARPTAIDVALIVWATGADIIEMVEGTDIDAGQVWWCARAMPSRIAPPSRLPSS